MLWMFERCITSTFLSKTLEGLRRCLIRGLSLLCTDIIFVEVDRGKPTALY